MFQGTVKGERVWNGQGPIVYETYSESRCRAFVEAYWQEGMSGCLYVFAPKGCWWQLWKPRTYVVCHMIPTPLEVAS